MRIERWIEIKNYEGIYQVSNFGNVRSIDRLSRNRNSEFILKGKELKAQKNKGYKQVFLSKNSNIKVFQVHRLVAEAFIPNLENKPEINHINGIRNDNRIENLEWCTHQENILHASKKLHKMNFMKGRIGEKSNAKKAIIQYDIIGNKIKIWNCISDVFRELGIGQTSIINCLKNRSKKSGGFIWKYIE